MKTNAQENSHNAYDDVAYGSYPFPQTNPIILQSIAKLFGLSTPPPETAHILEIGCAAGSNILSIASCFPNSQCVGIDYSQKQIEEGRKRVKDAGITNLDLKYMSIMDVTKDFGTFDYIISHGVLSWVPADVQAKLFEMSKENLSPDGIAYISYNTLPGWNAVRSIRDMMVHYTKHMDDPAAQIAKARQVLKQIHDNIKDSKSPLATAVAAEMKQCEKATDYFIFHEYLERDNDAFYFHDIITKAKNVGLQYLGDISLTGMDSGNMLPETAQLLAAGNDVLATEQAMDFIHDRRFRQTLLCHDDRILNRNVQPGALKEGFLISNFIYPQGFAQHNIASGQPLHFTGELNLTFTTDNAVILAMLQVFFEHKKELLSISQLTKHVRQKLEKINFPLAGEAPSALEDKLCALALRCLFIGGLAYHLKQRPYISTVPSKPKASKLARYQAGMQPWVSNQRQEVVYILDIDKKLLPLLDGTRDVQELVKAMMPFCESKELRFAESDVKIEDMAVIEGKMPLIIQERLSVLCDCGLLIA